MKAVPPAVILQLQAYIAWAYDMVLAAGLQFGWTADPYVLGSLSYPDDPRVSIQHTSPETGLVKVHFSAAGYVESAV